MTICRRALRLVSVSMASLALVAAALATAPTSAGAASSDTITVKATEYTYQFKGAPQPGWVTVQFENGGVEPHMMAVVKLKSGVTAKQLEKAALSQSDSSFAKIADSKNPQVSGMPELLSPGQSTATTAQMKAGHYGVLCFVPDPEGTMTHLEHGMVKTFDVKGSASSAKPPTDGVRDVTITDTATTLPSQGVPRAGTLKVTNEGTSDHSMVLIKLASGKTIGDAATYFGAWFGAGSKPAGAEPGVIVGGVSTIAPNGIAYLAVDLEPGTYGYASTEDADAAVTGLQGQFTIS